MKIGEAARRVGVPTHVLRHWEDEGVVTPRRTPSGHRDYSREHLHRLLIVRSCQAAGLTLTEIGRMLHRDDADRDSVISERLARIRRHREQLGATEDFLAHLSTCEHEQVSECTRCSAYARRSA